MSRTKDIQEPPPEVWTFNRHVPFYRLQRQLAKILSEVKGLLLP